jgi:hypothetical protein
VGKEEDEEEEEEEEEDVCTMTTGLLKIEVEGTSVTSTKSSRPCLRQVAVPNITVHSYNICFPTH